MTATARTKSGKKKAVDALFINPPLLLRREFIDYPYFVNLGVLQNAAVAAERGWKVAVVDSFAQAESGVFEQDESHIVMGLRPEEVVRLAENHNPSVMVVGLSAFAHPHRESNFLASLLDGLLCAFPLVPILLSDNHFGGMHYIDYDPWKLLDFYPGVEGVAQYETERILPEMIARILRGGGRMPDQRAVRGRAKTVDVAALPFPAWDMVDLAAYDAFLRRVEDALHRPMIFGMNGRALPAVSSRGCSFDCAFCSKNPGQAGVERRLHRLCPMDYMERCLTWLKEKAGARRVVFLDGLANPTFKRFKELLGLLNRLGLDYDFPNGLRADRLKPEHFDMMRGRVTTLSVSAESGSRRTSDELIGKKQPLEAVEKAAAECAKRKIPLIIHYMIGVPGERMEDMRATLSHAFRMRDEHGAAPSLQFATPLPGTPLFGECEEKNLIADALPADFAPAFTLAPMIETDAFSRESLLRLRALLETKMELSRSRKLIVNLTYRCLNQCVFCAVGDRPKEDLPAGEVLAFMEEARAGGVALLDFDGGEPTLHPDLLDLIASARDMGFERVTVTTNGRRLADKNFAARLLLSGISDLLVSIHGHTAEIHEKHTGEPGSFAETLAGIQNALRLKPERIDFAVNTTLTTHNWRALPEFAEFVIGLGATRLNVQFMTPFGRAAGDIAPDPKEVAPTLAGVIDAAEGRLAVNVINLPVCELPGYEDHVIGDIHKSGRVMVFVSRRKVNLADYLSGGRSRVERCGECPYAVVCEGEYRFEK